MMVDSCPQYQTLQFDHHHHPPKASASAISTDFLKIELLHQSPATLDMLSLTYPVSHASRALSMIRAREAQQTREEGGLGNIRA